MTRPGRTQTDPATPATPTWGGGIADPGPLGLAGFAGTTFFLSVVNTNMLGASVQGLVFGLAFSSYGAFWLSFWYLLNHLPEKAAPPDILHGVAVYLLVWTIFTAYMTVAALRTSGAVCAVFVMLTLTFLVLTIGFFSESVADFEANDNGWIHLGGWLGLITAVLAWYASFAGVTNSTFKRVVLPVFPLADR